jgi:hypothetical protein
MNSRIESHPKAEGALEAASPEYGRVQTNVEERKQAPMNGYNFRIYKNSFHSEPLPLALRSN